MNTIRSSSGPRWFSDDFVQRTHWRAEQTVSEKPARWLIPCSLLLASSHRSPVMMQMASMTAWAPRLRPGVVYRDRCFVFRRDAAMDGLGQRCCRGRIRGWSKMPGPWTPPSDRRADGDPTASSCRSEVSTASEAARGGAAIDDQRRLPAAGWKRVLRLQGDV